jgi:putative aldouronate transport system permease protein
LDIPLADKAGGRKRRVRWALYVMLVPGAAVTLVYSYGPLLGLVIAFQKFDFTKGLFGSEWIGLGNFRYIFGLNDFNRALGNTLFIAVFKLALGLAFPILISLLLNEIRATGFKRAIQTLIYLPFFISWVILAGIMRDILSPSAGILNGILGFLGVEPVFFLGDAALFPWVMIALDVWKGFGFGTILYLAALTGIDPNLYEAAGIDGAGRLRRMLHITLPGLAPIIVLNGTLSLGNVLNAGFDQIANLYSSVVYRTGDILDTLVYRVGIQSVRDSIPRYEIATTIGLFKSAVSCALISASYYLAHKFADYKIF